MLLPMFIQQDTNPSWVRAVSDFIESLVTTIVKIVLEVVALVTTWDIAIVQGGTGKVLVGNATMQGVTPTACLGFVIIAIKRRSLVVGRLCHFEPSQPNKTLSRGCGFLKRIRTSCQLVPKEGP
jgi:hypothetical protein